MTGTSRIAGCMALSLSLAWTVAAAERTPVQAAATNDDDSMMMPFYTGKIFPTPQKAVYRNEFFGLIGTGILTGPDIPNDDPRVRILANRIVQYGGSVSNASSLSDPCETFILVGDGAAGLTLPQGVEVPDKAEGYLIWSGRRGGKSVIVLKGHDPKGLLWAITSLNQMIVRKDGRSVVQAVEVADFPAHAYRGFIGSGGQDPDAEEPGAPSMMMAVPTIIPFKMNGVFFNYDNMSWRRSKWEWRDERPAYVKEDIRRTGEALSPLGIEWYLTSMPLSHWRSPKEDIRVQVRSKSEEDFAILFKQACLVEEAGGHFGIMYDDFRFDLHPDDVRDFGTAREADLYLLRKLDKALKAKYPKARLVFCPPFYWGPDSRHTYPESRDDYLAAIGQRLPPDVGIFWTGPRVKSGVVTKEQVAWITGLIKRKPLFFQNTKGTPHANYWHYVTDPITAWPEWHYAGFFDDVESYTLNVGMPGDLVAALTLVDFLWNPKAYDAGKSVEEAAGKLLGPESWPALVELNKRLSFFDQYDGVSPAAARNLPELERKLKEVEEAWQNAQAFHPGAVRKWTGMEWFITVQRNFIAALRKNPDLKIFSDAAAVSLKQAALEIAFDPATDLFLAATDFTGGWGPREYGIQSEKRLATWIYGARTPRPQMRAHFEVDPFPPSGDYTLIVSGQDDDGPQACRIRIQVNDTVLFEGGNGFATNGWSRLNFRIPGASLSRSCTLTIQNIEDTNVAGGPPYFMLNYAVLRKTAP